MSTIGWLPNLIPFSVFLIFSLLLFLSLSLSFFLWLVPSVFSLPLAGLAFPFFRREKHHSHTLRPQFSFFSPDPHHSYFGQMMFIASVFLYFLYPPILSVHGLFIFQFCPQIFFQPCTLPAYPPRTSFTSQKPSYPLPLVFLSFRQWWLFLVFCSESTWTKNRKMDEIEAASDSLVNFPHEVWKCFPRARSRSLFLCLRHREFCAHPPFKPPIPSLSFVSFHPFCLFSLYPRSLHLQDGGTNAVDQFVGQMSKTYIGGKLFEGCFVLFLCKNCLLFLGQ